jgi:glycosyltransferase involved in cell wall biosynthesis
MQVTVVIPAYNAQSTIGTAIDSVRAQTCGEWELIVVDGGSDDHTYKIACEYSEHDSRILAVQYAGCDNAVAALNLGVRERSRNSRYVLILDPDDRLVSDALEGLIEALEQDRSAVAAYGRFRIVDGAGNHLRTMAADRFTDNRVAVDEDGRTFLLPLESPLTFHALAVENCVKSTGQMLIRSEALRRLGPFDPKAFPNDDWDMWIRLSLVGEILLLDKIVLEYRTQTDGEGLANTEIDDGELYVRRKLAHLLAGDDLHAVALAGWRLRERRLVGRRFRSAMATGLAGRRSQAAIDIAQATRESFEYLYHWGLWRDIDMLPRHAGRIAMELRPATQS